MGETIDNSASFWAWAEVLMVAEDRLGVEISDADSLDGRDRFAALTLRELASVVRRYLPSEPESDERALRAVLEAAATVAKASIEPADADRPILKALRFSHW